VVQALLPAASRLIGTPADRAVRQGGLALLFERPKGHAIPVLI
jgi:3-polyprenyl-4-hydroxybenzoate decarboxylase